MAQSTDETNKKLDDLINSQTEDVLDQELMNDLKQSLEVDELVETLGEFDKNQSSATLTEDWQFSSLMIDKILNDEKYEQEKQRFFEEIARNANLDLTEGAENPQSRFETAFHHMTSLKKKTFEQIAPIAYSDLYAEMDKEISIQKSRKMLYEAGIKMPSDAIRDEIAESNRVGYMFHQKFGDPSINFESKLAEAAPQINKAFAGLSSDKAKKFGMLAVMTVATGGTNLAVKGGIFALKSAATSKRLEDTLTKGVSGFNSFLKSKGVNTEPLANAMASINEKRQKAQEKIQSTRWGRALTVAALAGAAIGIAAATGDLEPMLDKVVELGADVLDGKEPSAHGFDGRSATAGFDGVEATQPEVRAQGPIQDVLDSESTYKDPRDNLASLANAEAGQEAATGEYKDPRDNIAQEARDAAQAGISDVNSDFVINEIEAGTVELKVEPGGSVYESVKAHLTEVNGMPPSEQAVMQASSDILAEAGFDDPTKIPAGFEFDFRAEDYAYVESVSQETVDIARFGADGIPDGLKGQTVGEIATEKFYGTGESMTLDTVRSAVRLDLAASIDKGLDPNMKFEDWIAVMEQKMAALEAPQAPSSSLAASVTNEAMQSAPTPEGHAAPTVEPGNENAFEQYHERQQKYRSDMGLGQ